MNFFAALLTMSVINFKIESMKKKVLSLALMALVTLAQLRGEDVNTIVAQARSHLAEDAVLDEVKTLEYAGVIFGGSGERLGTLRLRFKKPSFQRLDITYDDAAEVTAVNAYEGYVQNFDADGNSLGLRVLTSDQVKQLQLNAHENLSFYLGPQTRRNAAIKYLATVEFEGKQAYKVRFAYENELFYYDRYFDTANGKLLSTVSGANGYELREKGSFVAGGIQFPKEVATYNDGNLVRRVVFDRIIVNAPMSDAIFDFPDRF
jgi:hypothetical protein